jgi:hypothetical protein
MSLPNRIADPLLFTRGIPPRPFKHSARASPSRDSRCKLDAGCLQGSAFQRLFPSSWQHTHTRKVHRREHWAMSATSCDGRPADLHHCQTSESLSFQVQMPNDEVRPQKHASRQNSLDCFKVQVLLARRRGFSLHSCDENDSGTRRRSEGERPVYVSVLIGADMRNSRT